MWLLGYEKLNTEKKKLLWCQAYPVELFCSLNMFVFLINCVRFDESKFADTKELLGWVISITTTSYFITLDSQIKNWIQDLKCWHTAIKPDLWFGKLAIQQSYNVHFNSCNIDNMLGKSLFSDHSIFLDQFFDHIWREKHYLK